MLVSIWRPVMLYPLFTEAGKEGDIAFVLQICWGRARVNIDWRFHLRPTHQNFKQFVRMISISTTHQTNQTLSLSFNLVALVGLLKMCCRGWMSTWLCTCGRAKELIFPQQGGVIQRKQMGNQSGLTKALYDCKRKQDPGLAKKRERERLLLLSLWPQPEDAAVSIPCSRLVNKNGFREQLLLSVSRPALGNLRMTYFTLSQKSVLALVPTSTCHVPAAVSWVTLPLGRHLSSVQPVFFQLTLCRCRHSPSLLPSLKL